MQHCDQEMTNWSYTRMGEPDKLTPHFYCRQCGNFYFEDKWYTKDEWFFYTNETTFAEHQHQKKVRAEENYKGTGKKRS